MSGSYYVIAATLIIIVVALLIALPKLKGKKRTLGPKNQPAPPAGNAPRNLWKYFPSFHITLPKSGTTAAQVLTSFLVFALVLYAMYGTSPNAKLFTTAEGWVTIAVYCVAMIAAALAAINFKGWAKVTPWIGMFIFFGLTGFHSWQLLNSDGVFEQRTHIASTIGSIFGGPNTNRVVVVGTPQVSGPPTGVTLRAVLGSTPIELNPGGSYHIRWDEVDLSQCVKIFDPSNRLIGDDCNGDLDLKNVRAAKFASARGDIVRVNYVLTPRWQ